MTLKAAWITPLQDSSRIFTLTLESAGVGDGERLHTYDHIFPITPVDAPKRHITRLATLTPEDLDLLRELLDASRDMAGYGRARVSKDPPTLEETLNG